MFVLNHEIKIREYSFKRIKSVEIEKSIHKIGATCTIVVPASGVLEMYGGERKRIDIAKAIKRGDKVKVSLGYNGELREEFVGVVASISYDRECIIKCEDYSFFLKKTKSEKQEHYTSISLKDYLTKILRKVKEVDIKIDEVNVPKITFDNIYIDKDVSMYTVLSKVKEEVSLNMYFADENLFYCGLQNQKERNEKPVIYNLSKNIVSSSLEYREKEDIKIKISAVAIDRKNNKIKVTAGEADGADRPFFSYYSEDFTKLSNEEKYKIKENLKIKAEQEIKKYTYDGYSGGLKGFLVPYCQPNYTVRIIDEKYPEKNGVFWVDSVKTSYGQGGARRDIEIGLKVSTNEQ